MDISYELVDRYVAEVGKDLPRKNRLDIEAELFSILEDMLREKSQLTGKVIDEQMIVDVLKEYGPPEKVAASYQMERQLVGPRLYPSFVTILQVILPIVAAIALVNMGISLGQTTLTFKAVSQAILLGVAKMISYAFTVIGAIVVLLWIFERFIPDIKMQKEDWNPLSLPMATSRNRVVVGATLLEILVSVFAIVLFNFFPQLINTGYYPDGGWWIAFIKTEQRAAWSITILSEAFFQYLPLLTTLWTITIALDFALLNRSRWENWSRWLAFGLRVAIITISGIMLTGPAIVNVSINTLVSAGFPDPASGKLMIDAANRVAISILVVSIIANLNVTIRLLVRLTGRILTPTLEKFAHP